MPNREGFIDEVISDKALASIDKGVIKIAEMVKNTNELATALMAVNSKGELKVGVNNALSSYNNLVEASNKAIKQREQERLAEIRLQQQRGKAFDAYERRVTRETKQRESAARAAEKAAQQEAKINAELINDYGTLSKAFNDAALRAKNYYLQLGAGSPITIEATKTALELSNKLKAADASVGQFQRNVGNYKSGFDGFGNSVQQILREAPSAAVSLNTFFLAISNNLPTLFDQIQQTNAGLKELKDIAAASNVELAKQTAIQQSAGVAASAAEDALSGQVETVINSIGASADQAAAIRGVVAAETAEVRATGAASAATSADTRTTLLNAGATAEQVAAIEVQIAATATATRTSLQATTALEAQTVATAEATTAAAAQPSVLKRLGASLFSVNTFLTVGVLLLTLFGGKIIDAFSDGEDAAKKLADAQKELEETTKRVNDSIADETSQLKILYAQATNTALSQNARLEAAKKLQDLYPGYLGNLTAEAIAAGKAAEAYKDITAALLEKISIEVRQEEIKRIERETFALQQQKKQIDENAKARKEAIQRESTDPNPVQNINQRDAKGNPFLEPLTNEGIAKLRKKELEETTKTEKEELDERIKNNRNAQDALLKDIQDSQGKIGKLYVKKDPKDKKEKDNSAEILKIAQDLTLSQAQEAAKQFEIDAEYQKMTIDNEKAGLRERLDATLQYYQLKLDAAEVLNDAEIRQREQALEKAKTQEEKDLLNQQISTLRKQSDLNEIKAIEEQAKATKAIIAKYSDEEVNYVLGNLDRLNIQAAEKYQQDVENVKSSLEKGKITQKQADAELRTLSNDYFKAKLDGQIEYIEESIKLLEIEGVANEKQIDALIKKLDELKVKRGELTQKGGKKGVDALGFSDEDKRQIREITELAAAAVNQISEIFTAINNKKMDAYRKEGEEIDKNKDKELAAIEASYNSKEEKKRLSDEAEAKAASKKAIVEAKARAEFRRNAERQKAINIALAAIQGVNFVLQASSIPEYIVRGVLAAASIAVAAATPIPSYATGTDDHIGGKAKIGDNPQRREYVFEPNKAPYVVTSPQIKDLPKHTAVIPSEQIMASQYYAMLTPQLIASVGGNSTNTKGIEKGLAKLHEDNKRQIALMYSANKKTHSPMFGTHNTDWVHK